MRFLVRSVAPLFFFTGCPLLYLFLQVTPEVSGFTQGPPTKSRDYSKVKRNNIFSVRRIGSNFPLSFSHMVSLHGRTTTFLSSKRRRSIAAAAAAVSGGSSNGTSGDAIATMNNGRVKQLLVDRGPPPDPNNLLDSAQLEEQVLKLLDWWRGKENILGITGAGLSTDSGIPDYRGSNGSYHRGHKPIIHQQYMDSEYQRKRYWGRSMVGWKGFDLAQPNPGHFALATLERKRYLGVTMPDKPEFYEPDQSHDYYMRSTGERRLSLITQNVDSLHERAGSSDVIHLHGRGNQLKCMQCGHRHDRNDFHRLLEDANAGWLQDAREGYKESTEMRPDGDALVQGIDYHDVCVPSCPNCGSGFYKPDVVFFGDSVPKDRVAICQSAVDHADGILVVGSSLAVHSAFRHVRAAVSNGIPVAILNVGETRAEAEELDHLLKIEAPASDTLRLLVEKLTNEEPEQAKPAQA